MVLELDRRRAELAERWGGAGCVWIVPEPGAAVDAAEVIAVCRARFARFEVPTHVVFGAPDDLPSPPAGEVQKFRIVAIAAEKVANVP